VRLTNQVISENSIKKICIHFHVPDVWNFASVAKALSLVLEAGQELGRRRKSLDFTDMIWLPVVWHLQAGKSFSPYKFLLVDECQDLNASQLELSCILAGAGGRMLFVGDPRQAIMGFAGADCDSYQRILEKVLSVELPLSVCYRCPHCHVELVHKIFPDIPLEPAPGAIDGKIMTIMESHLHNKIHLKSGDLIINRKTAPLVSLCIKLISNGVAAIVRGRAIRETLKSDLREIEKLCLSFKNFLEALSLYRSAKI